MTTKRPVASTAATYYPGQMVSINSSGYIVNAGDTASTLFAGICSEPKELVVPSGASNGDYIMMVSRPRYFTAKHSGLTIANIGALATILDNQTVDVAANTTNDIAAGRINRFISSTEVEIETLPFGQNA